VYLPDGIEPDTKPYRLYRAVARIALRSGANVVAVSVHGSRHTLFAPAGAHMRNPLQGLRVVALEPHTIPELVERSDDEKGSAAAALYARVREADAH
ncbi:MAG: 2-acyl-glycerophospho-ethanolamine acyltransferase, partial [Rhizobiaceae bacterium]|nr:2-acyl-glycerophospho-ethanolamine acyltransferase [Rhizobiaceae bacterium]